MKLTDNVTQPVLLRGLYGIGCALALLGPMLDFCSSFFVWQITKHTDMTITSYYGGVIPTYLALGGIILAGMMAAFREHPPVVAVGGLLGWWLVGGGYLIALFSDGHIPQSGLFLALSGACCSLIGTGILLFSLRKTYKREPLHIRQLLASIALTCAVFPPLAYIFAAQSKVLMGGIPDFVLISSIVLLILAIPLGIAAIVGRQGELLRFPYRIMGGLAISISIAFLLDTVIFIGYLFQGFGWG